MKLKSVWKAMAALVVVWVATDAVRAQDKSKGENAEFKDLVKKLEQVQTVGGKAVGVAGTPGQFYEIYVGMAKHGRTSDFESLLRDQRPILKLMGLYCLIKADRGNAKKYAAEIKALYADEQKVQFFPYGCRGGEETVGNIARQMVRSPEILEGDEKTPGTTAATVRD